MSNWYTRISGTVPLLSQKPGTKSQISPNWLNQYSLLGYSKFSNYSKFIVNKAIYINSKNPELQKKHIYLYACRSRGATVENLSGKSELLLIYMIASVKLQLTIA